ncbi:MAG: polysaccharide deacetylase family protein [Bacteroidales bacterium]|nr:polysaccharide deacetylase family protein [Bacteroidales bacterium]
MTLFIYTILLALGSYFMGLSFYGSIVNRLPKKYNNQKIIALSFDDGPNTELGMKLMDLLDKHQVKGNFFLIGKNIEQNKKLAIELHNRGHLLANHSYEHKGFFPLYSAKNVRDEIVNTNNLLEDITHKKNTYFRPPFGVTNPIIAKVSKGMGMTMIGWSLRTYDTVKTEDRLLKKLKSNIKNGDIVLMHELESSLRAVDKFIEYAKQKGYRFVLLSEFIR